ncbi:MAG: hypothetical protein WCK81_01085 [Betaproteobacteria bacterium]
MATPNYGYEKRQKELAKKRKKEDKLKSKSERKDHGDSDNPQALQDQSIDGASTEPIAAPPAAAA